MIWPVHGLGNSIVEIRHNGISYMSYTGSVTVKTFELLPDRVWILLDFPDFKHDLYKGGLPVLRVFVGRGPRTCDFHGAGLLVKGLQWKWKKALVITSAKQSKWNHLTKSRIM